MDPIKATRVFSKMFMDQYRVVMTELRMCRHCGHDHIEYIESKEPPLYDEPNLDPTEAAARWEKRVETYGKIISDLRECQRCEQPAYTLGPVQAIARPLPKPPTKIAQQRSEESPWRDLILQHIARIEHGQ